MAEPTAAQIALIRARVTDWTPTDETITAALNTPAIANPAAQGTIPRRLVKMEVLGLIAPGHVAAVLNYPNLALVYAAFDAQDHASATSWAQALAMIGAIDNTDAAAVIGYINTPVPDPAWPAQISWAQANLGRAADTADVWTARRSA